MSYRNKKNHFDKRITLPSRIFSFVYPEKKEDLKP